MKTLLSPLGLLSLWLSCLPGLAAVIQSEPIVTERGPHHRNWQRVKQETLPGGRVLQRTSGYTELATGMHYWKDGQWAESKELVEIFPDGGVARQGQHQVIFANNLNTAGAIDIQTSDGKRFRTHVLGIAYADAFGKSVMIAEVKDSIGEVIPPNVVLYRDAFTDFEADVRYTYTMAGFEQDIILRQDPPPPADYGLNPKFTRLEIYTEFLEAPGALKTTHVLKQEANQALRQAMAEPDLTDDTLDFGAMRLGTGSAFALGGADPFNDSSVPVGKSYEQRDGRQVLIEKVDYSDIQPHLQNLPKAAALNPQRKAAALAAVPGVGKAVIARHFPQAPAPAAVKKPLLMAQATPPRRGLVIDYSIVSSATDFTFRSDTTYFVTSDCQFSGTTVIEGGTVVKYTNAPSTRIKLNGPLDCRTSQFRPAFFTGKDDNTIGEEIGGSTGNPMTNYYGVRFLELAASSTTYDIHDIRVRHIERGIAPSVSTVTVILSHAQFYRCGVNAIYLLGGTVICRNVIAFNVPTFVDSITTGRTLIGEHLTLHRIPSLRSSTLGSVLLTNSLLISVTNNLVFTGGADVVTNLNDSGYFQTAAAGQYYLAAGSPHRNAGTANINPTLLSELKTRTTYPPVLVFSNAISSDVTLGPQAARDTDAQDIGYHYDPIDYSIGALTATNINLTVLPGTVLATYGTSADWALIVAGQSQFRCEGAPSALNRIIRYQTVQEVNTNWSTVANGITTGTASGAGPVLIRCRFTEWNGYGPSVWHLQGHWEHPGNIQLVDCRMEGGLLYSARPSALLTNCMFDSSEVVLGDGSGSYTPGHSSRGGLFYRTTVELEQLTADTWTWKDNLFSDSIVSDFSSYSINADYNGYTTNMLRIAGGGAHDVQLATNNLNFQSGALGRFYLPTSGPATNLFNTGSTNADLLELYHYTTTTDQAKETNSVVDISLHYVALNGSNQPVDTDGDGIADWMEDLFGNALVNSGETVWTNATDLGLRVQITNPRSSSPLP